MSNHGAGGEGKSPETFVFYDDIDGTRPVDHEGAAAWLAEAMERLDGTIISFGFRLPADVADLFEPGDFVGPILEAHYRDAIEWP